METTTCPYNARETKSPPRFISPRRNKLKRRQQHADNNTEGKAGGEKAARDFNCANRCGQPIKTFWMLRMPVIQVRACFNEIWNKVRPEVRLSNEHSIRENMPGECPLSGSTSCSMVRRRSATRAFAARTVWLICQKKVHRQLRAGWRCKSRLENRNRSVSAE
jgi:hypothetical protein